jgi:hypothetical protein
MSEQDRFEWNDDMEFDSDTDGQKDYDEFQDPLEGFADYDDMSGYEDQSEDESRPSDAMDTPRQQESETAEPPEEGREEGSPAGTKIRKTMPKQKRRRGLSAVGMGLLFSVSILVVGIGVGGAILFAEGVQPASLWQPQNLMQIDQLLNFTAHPLNILYIVAMGVAFLALLGSYKMAKSAVEANTRTREAEEMLDRVTALSLDRQEEWQSQEFKEFPPAEAFVMRTLGAWRLQEARQKRLMGVEGELHRLEKSLTKNSRSDLTGRFDHPAVGRLADEMIRYFDARDVAVEKLTEYENRDRSGSGEVVELVQESRQWNSATLDSLSVQCESLDKLAREMDDLAQHVEMASTESRSTEGMTDIIEAIRRDLSSQGPAGSGLDGMSTELNDLVDRGSKLAFQIAMEVARLGPRGERLLPMSQSLEDLTTGFRQLADQVNDRGNQPEASPGLRSVHKKLETLAVLITDDDQSAFRDMADEVQDFGPATARVSGHLTRLVDGFNLQENRLVKVGTSVAEMTGADFDSSSIPRKESSEAPVDSLGITRHESTSKSSITERPTDVNPFASSGASFLGGGDSASDTDFSSSALPDAADLAPGEEKPFPDASRELDGPDRFNLDADSATDMPLSGDEEKVYDLEDFGVSSTPEPEDAESDQVFDLASFDATPMDTDPDADQDEVFEMDALGGAPMEDESPATEEEVFEMDALGGAPMEDESPATEEEVFEMDALGGAPMEEKSPAIEEEVFEMDALGGAPMADGPEMDQDEVYDLSEFEAEPAEDPVFDLSDFGAKPMK